MIFHLHSKNEENSIYNTSVSNMHEKEMEIILKEANSIIDKQKSEVLKAKDNNKLGDKIKALESTHVKERQDSQKEFEVYKQGMLEKEARLEKDYRMKSEDMKINMKEIKSKFEQRCEEFKK